MKILPLALLLAMSTPASAGHGSRLDIDIQLDGRSVPLYPAVDGSDRVYVEAREGASYAIRLTNRSGERLGVQLLVDGLNVVSGERESAGSRGRMYVLGPWDSTTVRGWRTSLDEVRRFTFVDEAASYSARAGKANGRMGWIEVAAFREVRRPAFVERDRVSPPARVEEDATSAEAPSAPAPQGRADAADKRAAEAAPRSSHPGTGWGQRASDPARVVAFAPERVPVERMTLRYEYRPQLVALGVLPRGHSRLWQRERGEDGFVQPPTW